MRNTVVLNGLETHRLNLKKPVDVLVREFLSKFHDRFVSKSVVKYIIKQHLPHLTIPKHSDHDSASCGIHHSGDLFLKSFLKTEKLIDPNLSLSELASLACCEKPGKVLNYETRVRKFMRFCQIQGSLPAWAESASCDNSATWRIPYAKKFSQIRVLHNIRTQISAWRANVSTVKIKKAKNCASLN